MSHRNMPVQIIICLSALFLSSTALGEIFLVVPIYDEFTWTSGCEAQVNGSVEIDLPESPAIDRIEWDWGDGIVHDIWFPAYHIYLADGAYNVSVTPYDIEGNSVTDSFQVMVSGCVSEDNSGVNYLFSFGENGTGPGQFRLLAGLETDQDGNLYAAGWDSQRVQKFDAQGNYLLEWAGSGEPGGEFQWAADVAFDSSGVLYVLDTGKARVQKFTTEGEFLSEWTGSLIYPLNLPVSLDINSLDEVHISDYMENRVQVYDTSGNLLRQWGQEGTNDGEFRSPVQIAIDHNDNIFVADNRNNRIQKFAADSQFLLKWGSSGDGESQFQNAEFIALDRAGNLYVTDFFLPWVQKFDNNGNYIGRFGTPGRGPALSSAQRGIAVSATGLIYVSDYYQSAIHVYGSTVQIPVDETFEGSITTDDGQIELAVTAGDLASPETISIQQTAPEEIAADVQVGTSEGEGEVLAAYTLEPDGLEFAQPVELTMEIDVSGFSQSQRDRLDIYLHTDTDDDGIDDTFIAQNAVCTISDGPVFLASCTVEINHFSVYALIAPLDSDEDGDFIGETLDRCPGTVIPESVPTSHLGPNRWALMDNDPIFDTSAGGTKVSTPFAISDTLGCSCEQIIEVLGLGAGQKKFGCSSSVMKKWIMSNNP